MKGKTISIKKLDIIQKFIDDLNKSDIKYYSENPREIWIVANENYDFNKFGLPYEELN